MRPPEGIHISARGIAREIIAAAALPPASIANLSLNI